MSVETDLAGAPSAASDSVGFPASPETGEGCPSPLSWADVLDQYRLQGEPWTVGRGRRSISGRSIGTGAPLYFLNGIVGTSEIFCLLVWLLRDSFRCVTLDYPSIGWGRRPTADDLARDLFTAANAQGDETFKLFATSFGSVVGLSALELEPRRIDGAALLGGFAYRRMSRFERALAQVARFAPGRMRNVPFRAAIHRANHLRYFPPFDRSRWEFFVNDAGVTPIRDVARRAAIVRSFDFRPSLAQIAQPVLLIRTENEGRVSLDCHEVLARDLRNAKTEMMALTGQLAHLTHPHRLAKCLRAFFDEPAGVGSQEAEQCAEQRR